MNARISPARIERSLRQRLLASYRRDLPFQPARIIVGFSGGTDSLALALLFAAIQTAIPARVELLHIDHVIRPGSADDAEACQHLADAMHLPLRSVRLTAHPLTLYPGVGLEEAARRARYRVFAGVADQGDLIALAHQAGDQAETMLLHLMHGTGLTGLAGMQPVSRLQVPWWSNHEEPVPLFVWRPLLREYRADLEQVIAHAGLKPLQDPSNQDIHLKRNAIRHVALPALRSIEPTIDERLGTISRIVADEDRLIEQLADEAYEAASTPDGDLRAEPMAGAPAAIGRRVVRSWLAAALGFVPTLDRVEAVLELARTADRAAVVEVGVDQVVGMFGNVIRCGTMADLRTRAWFDAKLALPLRDNDPPALIERDTVVMSGSFNSQESVQRRLESNGAVTVRPVRTQGENSGQDSHWNDWFRREGISPWIRDWVQGVAIDGAMWWIPRLGDYDEPDGGRLVRLAWIDQEQS